MNFQLEQKKRLYEAFHGRGLTSAPHLHKHIELVLIKSGCCRATVGNREWKISEGDLLIVFPNQIHSYNEGETAQFSMIIASPLLCGEFTQNFSKTVPETAYIKTDGFPLAETAVEAVCRCRSNGGKYSDTQVRGYLLVLLSEFFKQTKFLPCSGCDNDLFAEILSYCNNHFQEKISVKSVGNRLHISSFYISRLFNERLHTGFRDYINSLRIEKARELIKSGELSINEIAYNAGYDVIRTFNRCFLKNEGITPREYRERALLENNEM